MRNTKMTTAAGISLAALLALTACGDDTDADAETNGEAASEETGDVFDFGDNTDVSGEEIRIELPADLADTEDRVLDAAVVSAGKADDSECAIEVQYEYADGAEADIEQNDWEQPTDWEGGDGGVGSPTEWGDVSLEHRHARALGITEGAEIEGNNDAEVLSDDLQSATFPVECATGVEIQFTALEWSEGTEEETPEDDTPEGPVEDPGTWYDYAEAEVETLATVSVNVSESGEVTITDSQIH